MLTLLLSLAADLPRLQAYEVAPARWDVRLEAAGVAGVDGFFFGNMYGPGLIVRGELTRRFAKPYAVGARLSPLGLANNVDPSISGDRTSDVLSALGYGFAAFDPGSWALSLGAGYSSINRRGIDEDATGAPLLVTGLRVGAIEGRHARFDFGLVAHDGGIHFGHAELDVILSTGERGAFAAHAVYSRSGLIGGELGARHRIRWDPKKKRRVDLRWGVGFSQLYWREVTFNVFQRETTFRPPEWALAGPTINLGLHWIKGTRTRR